MKGFYHLIHQFYNLIINILKIIIINQFINYYYHLLYYNLILFLRYDLYLIINLNFNIIFIINLIYSIDLIYNFLVIYYSLLIYQNYLRFWFYNFNKMGNNNYIFRILMECIQGNLKGGRFRIIYNNYLYHFFKFHYVHKINSFYLFLFIKKIILKLFI